MKWQIPFKALCRWMIHRVKWLWLWKINRNPGLFYSFALHCWKISTKQYSFLNHTGLTADPASLVLYPNTQSKALPSSLWVAAEKWPMENKRNRCEREKKKWPLFYRLKKPDHTHTLAAHREEVSGGSKYGQCCGLRGLICWLKCKQVDDWICSQGSVSFWWKLIECSKGHFSAMCLPPVNRV